MPALPAILISPAVERIMQGGFDYPIPRNEK